LHSVEGRAAAAVPIGHPCVAASHEGRFTGSSVEVRDRATPHGATGPCGVRSGAECGGDMIAPGLGPVRLIEQRCLATT